MVKKKQRKQIPYFGNGILSDSATTTDSGKINAQGIFTLFWAWDFPCERRGIAIITLFDLPEGKTKLSVSVQKKGSKAKKLKTATIDYKKHIPPLTSIVPIGNLTLTSSGSYELLFSIPLTRKMLKIPFEVIKKSWPQYTTDEINFVKANPHVVKSIRANILCSKCSYAYVFEETLLETPLLGGVHRFPETGKFKCINCNHTLRLRDVQGQLMAALKEQIKQSMEKIYNV